MTFISVLHNPAFPTATDFTPFKLFKSLLPSFSKVEKTPDDILAAKFLRADARRAVDNLLR